MKLRMVAELGANLHQTPTVSVLGGREDLCAHLGRGKGRNVSPMTTNFGDAVVDGGEGRLGADGLDVAS